MKFRSQTLTALRALLDLCLYTAPGQPAALPAIARRQGLSAAFLEQLFRRLKSAGIVSPWRGVRGGYTLCKPADQITLWDIFQALSEPLARRSAPKPQERVEAEVVRQALEEAAGAFQGKLALISLADLKRRALAHPAMRNAPRADSALGI